MSSSAPKSWFSTAFGYSEHSDFAANQAEVAFDHATHVLTCKRAGGKMMYVGPFECASLGELRSRLSSPGAEGGLVRGEVVGNVKHMHVMEENRGAVFMVASQVKDVNARV